MMNICHMWDYNGEYMSKPMESITSRENCNINYGLWVIMACRGKFNNYNRYNPGRDVDNMVRENNGIVETLCTSCSIFL